MLQTKVAWSRASMQLYSSSMARKTDVLSERQKEALRLALTMTSDQIAGALARRGESTTTKAVNNRIDAAREKLGGMGRRQAAELLALEEGRLVPDRLVHRGDKIPERKIPIPVGIERSAGSVLPNEAEAIDARSIPLDRQGARRRNELDTWQRIGVILLLMAVLAGAASAYIAVLRR